MKKSISLFALILLFSCVKESPFEKSITEYVKTDFKDPTSYEKISIEVLDTVTVAKKIKVYESKGMTHEQYDNEPKDKFLYYTVSHKYRANNSYGAKELYNDIVSMDKDFKITGSHAIDE
jgi:hypothetical protein